MYWDTVKHEKLSQSVIGRLFRENNWDFYFSRGYKFQTNFSVGTT